MTPLQIVAAILTAQLTGLVLIANRIVRMERRLGRVERRTLAKELRTS